MNGTKKELPPREGMRLWYERELELFRLGRPGANDYDRYAPTEARAEVKRLIAGGAMPRLYESHFALWEALLEVMGWDYFEKPLGLQPDDAAHRLLGRPLLIKRGQMA